MAHLNPPSALLEFLTPLRRGVVNNPRHSLRRSICIAVLKQASKRLSIKKLAEIRPLDRPQLSFEPTDSMVIDALYWFGVQGYEGILGDTWRKLCSESLNTLEIGGNVGLYSVIGGIAARGRYTVLEPVPSVAKVLRANLIRNLVAGVEVIEAAAVPGNEHQRVELNLPREGRDAPVGAHLMADSEVSGRSSDLTLVVDGIPFRELAKGRQLIKIDAEGIESALLNSAWEILSRERPILITEVLPEADQLANTIRRLANAIGYQIYIVPAYGSDKIVSTPVNDFSASTPAQYNSKDVILSVDQMTFDNST